MILRSDGAEALMTRYRNIIETERSYRRQGNTNFVPMSLEVFKQQFNNVCDCCGEEFSPFRFVVNNNTFHRTKIAIDAGWTPPPPPPDKWVTRSSRSSSWETASPPQMLEAPGSPPLAPKEIPLPPPSPPLPWRPPAAVRISPTLSFLAPLISKNVITTTTSMYSGAEDANGHRSCQHTPMSQRCGKVCGNGNGLYLRSSEGISSCFPWPGETKPLTFPQPQVVKGQEDAAPSRSCWDGELYANICRTLDVKALFLLCFKEDSLQTYVIPHCEFEACQDTGNCFFGQLCLCDRFSSTKSIIGRTQPNEDVPVSEDGSRSNDEECQWTQCLYNTVPRGTLVYNLCLLHRCWRLSSPFVFLPLWIAYSSGIDALLVCTGPQLCKQFQRYFLAWTVSLLVGDVHILCYEQIVHRMLRREVFSRKEIVCLSSTSTTSTRNDEEFQGVTKIQTSDWEDFVDSPLYQTNSDTQVNEEKDGLTIRSHPREREDGVTILRHREDLIIMTSNTASLIKEFEKKVTVSSSDQPGDVWTEEEKKMRLVLLNQKMCFERQENVKTRPGYYA